MPRTTKGRQKIKMAKMENESNLMVTFSKRRPGLFKKASELSILCGVEIAIVVFSPGKKAYSFGHPSVEMIADRYLAQNPHPNSSNSQLVEAFRNANIYELGMQLTYVNTQLEIEKKRGEELTNIRNEGMNNHWWQAPIESLGLQELEKLKESMEWLKSETEQQKNRILAANQLSIIPSSSANGLDGGYNQLMGSGPIRAMTPHGYMLGYGYFNR